MKNPHENPCVGIASDRAETLRAGIPLLETERLTLRAPELADFTFYAEIACGARGTHLDGPMTREEAWNDFTRAIAVWLLRGHGLWTVIDQNTDDVLGFALLGFEPGDHEPELGFLFRELSEGKGYAKEAATAVRGFAFDVLGMKTLVSTIDFDNARSRRLAERLGGTRDAVAEAAHGSQICVFRYQSAQHSGGTK